MTNFNDTIDRPDFLFKRINLYHDVGRVIMDLDTSLQTVSIVEPYFRDNLIRSNLGSENSANLNYHISPLARGIHSGAHAYSQLFQETDRASIVDVNRSFWSLHYGSGTSFTSSSLSSSNLKADFYRSFARNILFNFSYQTLSDDGWLPLQTNKFSQMDIKFFQNAKSGKRISFIHYKSPKIEENINPQPRTNALISIPIVNGNRSLTIGNTFIQRDTNAVIDFQFEQRLTFSNSSYSIDSTTVGAIADDLLGPAIFEDTLYFRNAIQSVKLHNLFRKPLKQGSYYASLETSLLRTKLGGVVDEGMFQVILGFGYDRKIGDFSHFKADGELGLSDASGYRSIQVGITQKLPMQVQAAYSLRYRTSLLSTFQMFPIVNERSVATYDFKNLSGIELRANFDRPTSKTYLDLSYSNYNTLTLLDDKGFFFQLPQAVHFVSARLKQNFNFGPLSTEHQILFNHYTSNEVANLPFQYAGNVYIDFTLFGNKMQNQFGSTVHYIPSYDVPEFSPVAGSFYNWRSDVRSGNIVILSPYFHVRVDRLFMFFKAVNIGRQLFPSTAALTTGFPIYDTRFRFGIRWTLLD